MKSTFEDLKEWLRHRMDHFYYEDRDGNVCFDEQAMLMEIDVFSDEVEKQIH